MSDVDFSVAGLSNLDVIELKATLANEGLSNVPLDVAKEPPKAGRYNDPALATALIKIAVDNAPVVLPTLVSAIALWIAKGKKADRVRGKVIEITWGGVRLASYESDRFEEADAAAILGKLKTIEPTTPGQ